MSNTPRTDALYAQFGPVLHPAVMAYNSLARELERALTAQIEGHKLTAKEASEAAVLRAENGKLRRALQKLAELKFGVHGVCEPHQTLYGPTVRDIAEAALK